jgi:hypothetical protein
MGSRFAVTAVAVGALIVGAAPASGAEDYDFLYRGEAVATLSTTAAAGITSFSFTLLSAPSRGAFINDILLDMGRGAFSSPANQDMRRPSYSYREAGFQGTGLQTKISFQEAQGPGRFRIGETATWTIAGAFDGPAQVHINAFLNGESIKLTTPVSEPESYAMALVALGVLGAYRRFSRSKS